MASPAWPVLAAFGIAAIGIMGVAGCEGDSGPAAPATTAPAAPANLVASAESYSQISLVWTDASSDEAGFRVFRGTSSDATTLIAEVAGGTTAFADTGLADTTTFFYRVHSFNAAGNSAEFASVSATTFMKALYGLIRTFAGTGFAGLGSDGLPPLETPLYLPVDISFGRDGRPYVIDWNNHRVRVIENGVTRTILGTGELGDARAGLGTEISLNHPTHVSFDPQGRLILSAWHNSKLMRMDLTTNYCEPICGDGRRAFGGDEGPATLALLDLPVATAFDPQGRLYVSDQANQRIRMIDGAGIIHTVVGTGVAGFSGDGGAATAAQLNLPRGQRGDPAGRIVMDPMGVLYIADTENNRVRMVDAAGIITTVAGNGAATFAGDGGPATEASLSYPTDVALDPDGNLYIADTRNNCVRRVDTNGIITTFAGRGRVAGYAGDGGHPKDSLLYRPYGVACDAEGNVYIADAYNYRIRVVVR